MTTNDAAAGDTAVDQPHFSIEKIYIKGLSLEIPHAPQIYLNRESPQIDVEIYTAGRNVDQGVFEVSLNVTVTARVGDKTMFLVEANQAGIFVLRNFGADEVDPVLGIACPNILFPYVRAAVSDLVTQAGFAPVYLTPVNFEAVYQQRLAQAQAQLPEATVQ